MKLKLHLSKISKLWWFAGAGWMLALLVVGAQYLSQSKARVLTQADIDAAVLHTLATKDLPSRLAKAAAIIMPSVVHVLSLTEDEEDVKAREAKEAKEKLDKKAKPQGNKANPKAKDGKDNKADDASDLPRSGIGSGVVISEEGIILTNWHVVQGAKKIIVTFADGTRSPAVLKAAMPENDMAVLKAERLPDDLVPATLGGSGGLQMGDEVVAVGFPFGIGPSTSAGVVSGLNRHFKSEGKTLMKGLIQADAAANPGNSGGPLVNMQGEVVGIVTAILNPTEARTFIGIVFAATIESAGGALGIPPF